MTLDEKILRDAQKLPPSLQEELFEFAQYLLMKAEQKEKQDWTAPFPGFSHAQHPG
jgi:hypothetical protein